MSPAVATPRRISLSNVKTTLGVQPYRTLAHGGDKTGKSSMFAHAPRVIALDIEGRLGHIDVQAMPRITTWEEALDALEVLRVEKHDYENVMVDSVTSLEKLMKVAICREANWDPVEAEDYSRWVKLATTTYWPSFFSALERLERERGMGILMTAHGSVKSMKNPRGEAYDRFRPNLGGSMGPELFLHFCHDVLYLCFEDLVRREKAGGKEIIRTSTTGRRIAYATACPAWDAGNSCGLPDSFLLGSSGAEAWATYARLRADGLANLATVQKRIADLLSQIVDPETKAKATAHYEAHKTDVTVCREVASRLQEIVAGQAQAAAESTAPA